MQSSESSSGPRGSPRQLTPMALDRTPQLLPGAGCLQEASVLCPTDDPAGLLEHPYDIAVTFQSGLRRTRQKLQHLSLRLLYSLLQSVNIISIDLGSGDRGEGSRQSQNF